MENGGLKWKGNEVKLKREKKVRGRKKKGSQPESRR